MPLTVEDRLKETSVALGEEYLRKRNQILDLKFKREAMNLALDRDQLVEKHLLDLAKSVSRVRTPF